MLAVLLLSTFCEITGNMLEPEPLGSPQNVKPQGVLLKPSGTDVIISGEVLQDLVTTHSGFWFLF